MRLQAAEVVRKQEERDQAISDAAAAQAVADEKEKQADLVINNAGDKTILLDAVNAVYKKIQSLGVY